MCELLGMSSARPTCLGASLRLLAPRGGETGPHRDGWGIAYLEGHDVQLFREVEPAARSGWFATVRERGLRSHGILAHIRAATQGDVSLANTQPFVRELGGRVHVFAHNGHLERASGLPLGRFRPVGDTDSEIAFGALLHALEPLWLMRSDVPSFEQRLEVISDFAARIGPLGPANFLYTDGDVVFAHGNARKHEGVIRPPGLWTLRRTCHEHGGPQEVHLFASVPLTEEAWRPLDPGELVAVRDGKVLARVQAGAHAEGVRRPARSAS